MVLLHLLKLLLISVLFDFVCAHTCLFDSLKIALRHCARGTEMFFLRMHVESCAPWKETNVCEKQRGGFGRFPSTDASAIPGNVRLRKQAAEPKFMLYVCGVVGRTAMPLGCLMPEFDILWSVTPFHLSYMRRDELFSPQSCSWRALASSSSAQLSPSGFGKWRTSPSSWLSTSDVLTQTSALSGRWRWNRCSSFHRSSQDFPIEGGGGRFVIWNGGVCLARLVRFHETTNDFSKEI